MLCTFYHNFLIYDRFFFLRSTKEKSKAILTQNIEPSGKLPNEWVGQQEMPIAQQAVKKIRWQERSGKTIYVTVLGV